MPRTILGWHGGNVGVVPQVSEIALQDEDIFCLIVIIIIIVSFKVRLTTTWSAACFHAQSCIAIVVHLHDSTSLACHQIREGSMDNDYVSF
mmetsp:Transcript_59601/g.126240  ORF Transcript_59601/g.126240 Transcript_59601/m.126240 type:complete len:91 (+) Transcript_59601:400-672(+)|eukprot:CAMPEP_0206435712 /NCGR_PEP_ID=MMETSP0324_2-20121206/10041_1 /ASSEMBLY_ACC=CAM_ASM_000836 /TAXON_ID=2866 /ORGANISM="Crypthecodinium cohnii, Strain Seligo" /LENGTH=90 /DNA_ID=CAMNT_0053902719 /DNA_START=312 /DNA_END=584 /DNA_ORIENTATION=+